jgi:hypothetical protein
MAAVSLPNPAVEPNYATLAARYDSDDDEEASSTEHNPSSAPTQHTPSAGQQPLAAAAAGAANGHSDTAACGTAAATVANGVPNEYDDVIGDANEEGWEEDSDEGDDDELYAALEWADSREGVCMSVVCGCRILLLPLAAHMSITPYTLEAGVHFAGA